MNEINWISLYTIFRLIILNIYFGLIFFFSYFVTFSLLGLFCFACDSFLLLLLMSLDSKHMKD